MPGGGLCCAAEVCCPPREGKPSLRAKRELAAHLAETEPDIAGRGSYEDVADRVLNGFRLVPRSIDAGPEPATAEHLASAQARLRKLLSHIQGELTAIYIDAGYDVKVRP